MQAGGRLALAQENFALAADLFASARDRDVFEAKRNQVYAWLADAAAQGGAYEPTAAVDAYVSILLDPLLAQPARQRLAQALGAGLDRLDGDAHEAMAQKLLQAGAPSTAQPIMWALVEHYAGPNGENREGNALLYERLADLATHMNDYDRAEQVYNAALQRWPLDAALRYARGNFLFTHTNKTGQAAEDLAQAIAQAPHDENNYRLLVDVYNKAGRHGELTMLLDLAKKNNPELAWPYQLSGEVLLDTLRAGHGAGANPPHNPVNLPAAP
jgi:predicted Zn-dependent protease